MNRLVVVIMLAALWGGWNWWRNERAEHVPPGIVAPAAPVQTNLDSGPRFEIGGYHLLGRARYDLEARILRKEIYRLDGGAALAPVDLGVGWGPMSDTAVVGQLEYPVDVSLWIDHRPSVTVGDEVASVAEPGGFDDGYVHCL